MSAPGRRGPQEDYSRPAPPAAMSSGPTRSTCATPAWASRTTTCRASSSAFSRWTAPAHATRSRSRPARTPATVAAEVAGARHIRHGSGPRHRSPPRRATRRAYLGGERAGPQPPLHLHAAARADRADSGRDGDRRRAWRAGSGGRSGGVMAARVAMLTGGVNIAVFAAFWPRVGGILLSNAEFKRLCRPTELDVSCYGWQKRQRSGKKRQEVASWVAKAARMGGVAAASTPPQPLLP